MSNFNCMSTESVTPTESTARHPFRTLLKPTMDQGMKKNTNFPQTKFLGSAPELLLQKRFEAIFTLRQNWCKTTLRDIVRGTKAMVQNASKNNSEQTFLRKRCHIYTANIRHSRTAHYFSDVHFLCFLWPSGLAVRCRRAEAKKKTLESSPYKHQ